MGLGSWQILKPARTGAGGREGPGFLKESGWEARTVLAREHREAWASGKKPSLSEGNGGAEISPGHWSSTQNCEGSQEPTWPCLEDRVPGQITGTGASFQDEGDAWSRTMCAHRLSTSVLTRQARAEVQKPQVTCSGHSSQEGNQTCAQCALVLVRTSCLQLIGPSLASRV